MKWLEIKETQKIIFQQLAILSALWILSFFLLWASYSQKIDMLFWLGVFSAFSAAIFGIRSNLPEGAKICMVILLLFFERAMLFAHIPYWGYSAYQWDAMFNLQLSEIIKEDGRWMIEVGTVFARSYSYNPALHLWCVAVNFASGINLFEVSLMFSFLSSALTLVFYYFAIRYLAGEKIAIWSAFIYSLNQTFVFFDHYVMESYGLVFYSMLMYIIFRKFNLKSKYNRLYIIGLLASFAVSFSHVWTTINLLIFWFAIFLFAKFYSLLIGVQHKNRFSIPFMLVSCSILLVWTFTFAYPYVDRQINLVIELFYSLIAGRPSYRGQLGGLSLFEKAITYSGQAMPIIIGISRLRNDIIRRRKNEILVFLDAWFIFSVLFLVLGTFFAPANIVGEGNIARRSWEFAYFGISPLIAFGLHNEKKSCGNGAFSKKLSLDKLRYIFLILTLVSINLMYPDYYVPGYSYRNSAFWVRRYMPDVNVTLDVTSCGAILSYGRTHIGPYSNILDVIYSPSDYPDEFYLPLLDKVVICKKIETWHPQLVSNLSFYDYSFDRLFDSPTITIYEYGRV